MLLRRSWLWLCRLTSCMHVMSMHGEKIISISSNASWQLVVDYKLDDAECMIIVLYILVLNTYSYRCIHCCSQNLSIRTFVAFNKSLLNSDRWSVVFSGGQRQLSSCDGLLKYSKDVFVSVLDCEKELIYHGPWKARLWKLRVKSWNKYSLHFKS